jgi:glycosyltransferase involved in cell wall biosynthesis
MTDFVIQLHAGEYHDFARYLTTMQFQRIDLNAPALRFKTARQLLLVYFCGAYQLLQHLRSFESARTVVVFSHFAFVVKLLARLRLLRYGRLVCFGFFLHDPHWLPICRWLVRLDRTDDHYVVFSEFERDLYASQLGVPLERMHFVPLGDWGQIRQPAPESADAQRGDYYFAGGRSNREYLPLVEAFRSISAQLIIVCSGSNWEELKGISLPENVSVLSDVPVDTFDEYVRGAKAGIIPLKRDMGSSGQSVALALMRNARCVIATNAGGLHSYIEHGVSGFLMSNLAEELPALIHSLELEPDRAAEMGRAARERYEQSFSLAVAAEAFEQVLGSIHLESAA